MAKQTLVIESAKELSLRDGMIVITASCHTQIIERLRTAIELTDLIGEAVTPRWSIDFSNIKQWQRNRYDTRGVKLTLRYTFNSVNTSFRDAQINKSSDGRVD